MNVNLSNVSATNKTSASESSAKAPTESSESKGFFETLAGVFTGSQKAEKAEKAVTQTASTDAKTDVSATEGETVEKNGESQESVANRESVDGKAADALLEHEA